MRWPSVVKTTLLEQVRLVHQSLPDLSLDDIDLSTTLFGKPLRAPLVIAAMTGGTDRAAQVNKDLSGIAERRGYGFGLGSQRAMQRKPETAWTYQVREWAPSVLLFGNIGTVQATACDTKDVNQLMGDIGADALCLHMNPAMELIQPGGDRDFRHGTDTFRRYVEEMKVPVIAKETGNGISLQTAEKLRGAGVETVDVSGAGGTSWVGVETLRAQGDARELGELLWDWGVPTGASVLNTSSVGLTSIATGGLSTGLDVARAIVLGARLGGIARQVFMAYTEGGVEGAEAFFERVEQQLRAVMLLCGCRDLKALRNAPRMLGSELQAWIPALAFESFGGQGRFDAFEELAFEVDRVAFVEKASTNAPTVWRFPVAADRWLRLGRNVRGRQNRFENGLTGRARVRIKGYPKGHVVNGTHSFLNA